MSSRVLRLGLALSATALLSGCAGFRGAWRDFKNTDMLEARAPVLVEGVWVSPDSGAEPRPASRDWMLLAFFLPG